MIIADYFLIIDYIVINNDLKIILVLAGKVFFLFFSSIVNEGFGSLFYNISQERTKTKKNPLKIYDRVEFP